MRVLRVVVVVALVLVGFGCKGRIPEENTPAFDRLHGVINDGKTVNEVTLINDQNDNHPRLRFPSDIPVTVYTPETHGKNPKTIRKGFAYEAKVALELSAEKKLKAIVRTPENLVYDTVEIRFSSNLGSDNKKIVEDRLREFSRHSFATADKLDLGLREYTPTIAGKLQAYEYVPLDSDLKSVDGSRIWIRCDVGGARILNNQGPAECASHFDYKDGLSVVYVFRASLLPYWRQIYKGVVYFSDFALVK